MAEDGKLKIDSMMDMISVSVRCRSKTLYIRRRFRSLWQKLNLQAAIDSDDTLVCCVENTVKDRIMDFGALFHATYCKEELERFKLRSGKVCLADDKTLDIAGVGDVVLKTSFGTSWTLKDVRYIPSLKRRLISVGQLDEEGYHVGFGDQQLKVTKGSPVVVRRNKCGSLYMVEDWWFEEAEESFFHNVSEDKETTRIAAGVMNGIMMLEMVPKTPLQFGVAERLSRTFRVESTGIHAEDPKMLWADSVSTTCLIYRIPYVTIGLCIVEEEWRGNDTSLTYLKVFGCDSFVKVKDVCREAMKCTFIGSGSDEIAWVEFRNHLEPKFELLSSDTSEGSKNSGSFEDSGRSDEEYSEDGASSKEGGSETPQNGELESYSEALSSKEFVQWKKAIIEEMVKDEQNGRKRYKAGLLLQEPSYVGLVNDTSTQHKSKGFQLARQKENLECRLKEIMYGLIQVPRLRYLKFDSFMQKDKMKDIYSEKQVLGYVLTVGVTTVEWESRLQKSITMVLIFVEDSWNEEPCRDVHQVGDEREVEVLRSFNWPPSELITEDGVLPERGYSQFNDVSSGYLVSKVS
ncbi:retrovirus-related pol polyprotein from transposon TNT 1-94 [Tanacetum coccineum]